MLLNVLRVRSLGLPIEVYVLSFVVACRPQSAHHGLDAVTCSPTGRPCKTLSERFCLPAVAKVVKAATAECMPGTGGRLVCKIS